MPSRSSSTSRPAASTFRRATPPVAAPWRSRAPKATRALPTCWLRISPQSVERCERGKRRGFGAQHAGAERCGDEARVDERRVLLRAEARLRPGGEDGG